MTCGKLRHQLPLAAITGMTQIIWEASWGRGHFNWALRWVGL